MCFYVDAELHLSFKLITNFSRISVRLGEHNITSPRDCADPSKPETCSKDDPPFQDIEIESHVVHKDYDPRKKNDIALLRLKTAVIMGPMTKGVATICLPVKISQTIEKVMEDEPDLNELNIAGWGYTEDNPNSNSDVLKQASLPFITNDQCIELFEELKTKTRSFSFDITEGHMVRLIAFKSKPRDDFFFHIKCAGGHNKTDACSGDSGGPLTAPALNERDNYKFFQQGIITQGVSCSSTAVSPGIYTRVFHYMKWILDNLED